MTLSVVVVYPDLLGTYGDGGNALVLARRAQWRGIGAEVVEALSGDPLPAGDLYCLGGGEDGPQLQAAEQLQADGGLARGVERGATVLAVCAGYQIVGTGFPAADGRPERGLGLLDVVTAKGSGRRAVGEILAEPAPTVSGGDGPGTQPGPDGAGGRPRGDQGPARPEAPVVPLLSGFENHGGRSVVGPRATPLARVVSGVGNGDGTEGARCGRVVGTYLHGPVLARNPALADLLLGWATGRSLEPLADDEERALRARRIAAVRRHRVRS